MTPQIFETYVDAQQLSLKYLKEVNYHVNPVVVFDIDDTLLFSTRLDVIKPMLDLYNHIKSLGIPLVLITARAPQHYVYTENQLAFYGIVGYEQLLMCRYKTVDEIPQVKAVFREMLSTTRTVFLNVGDQDSDFEGGHFEYGIKLHSFLK